ncbi:MAG: hypothetical protein V8T37_01475 [Streptococcus sp.]
MTILREIGIIARALDSIANIEFRHVDLAQRAVSLFGAYCRRKSRYYSRRALRCVESQRSTVARSVKKLEVTRFDSQTSKGWKFKKGKGIY